MTKNIIGLVTKSTAKKGVTYGEVLQKHLESLSEDERALEVDFIVIGGCVSDDVFFSLPIGNSITQALGTLEVIKSSILMPPFDDYED